MAGGDLSGAVAVVTGASSGIGRELARQLAARGVGEVWLVARREARLRALADELGPVARVFAADLSTDAGCRALVAAVPRVDVLVNNAGLLVTAFFEDTAAEDADALTRIIDVNIRALTMLTAAWVPGMVGRKRGWVLNVGSISGDGIAPLVAVYGASKRYVSAFTEAVRMEVAGQGVQVSLLAPGPVRTDMVESLVEAGLRVPGLLAVDADRCAREGLDRLFAGKARTTPKLAMRLIAGLSAMTPIWLLRLVFAVAVPWYRRRTSGAGQR